jgi:peptidoglycan/xylan/chitin deacetylase (PgdA/CDA1 family)
VKRAVKRIAVAAGRLMPQSNPSTRRVVLCYHSVHPARRLFSTTPQLFDRHVQWLTEHCRLTSLVNLLTPGVAPESDRPRVAITFDDGYDDNHAYALPILAKWGASATFFVTAGFIERDPVVMTRFQHLLRDGSAQYDPLDWAQVRELHASGMDIGSHTYGHPSLARLGRHEVELELARSKSVIGERLGCEIDLLAYPFGKPKVHFTRTTIDIARATGYRIAAAVIFRGVQASDSRFAVPRFFVDGDSLEKLEARVRGAYELIGWWQEHAPLSAMKIVSPQDFER